MPATDGVPPASNSSRVEIAADPEREPAARPFGVSRRKTARRGLILLVEDDRGDQLLIHEALRESGVSHEMIVVSDGEEALQYLHRTGDYQDPASSPRPNVILLDLNMPRVNGRQVAAEIKADARLRSIPVVVFSTSDYPDDVTSCYESGVNSYVHKPTDFDEFVETISAIEHYWLHVVVPPALP